MNDDQYLPTRHSLINRLKNWSDDASWQEFFNIYWRFIYGVALKSGLGEPEAQEVVQETVITVAKKIKDFQVGSDRGSFKAWLVHTTRWRIADQFRKRTSLQQAAASSPEDTSRTSTIERVADPASLDLNESWEKDWEQNLFQAAMEKAKEQVDNRVFQMFYLHAVKDWPVQKVAETTGAKAAQVYFAKYKVSRLIKKEVARLRRELI